MSDEQYLAVVRQRIKVARLAMKLRQEDVADILDISVRSYQRYEGGGTEKRFNPYATTLRRIAVALQVDVSQLVREPSQLELDELTGKYSRQRVRLARS